MPISAPKTAQVPFWRRTPPAAFPPIMGLFGLGLAWRRAVGAFGISPAFAELILGATTLIFLFLFATHIAKFCARPATLIEDLRIVPGRTGLAAASLCVLLLAATVVPYSPLLAKALLFGGLIWHLGLAALTTYVLFASPPEARKTTPAWHLSFVGFIVAPLSAIPLGLIALAGALWISTLVTGCLILAISAEQLMKKGPPPPLRPLLAIHLAPLSLFGTIAFMFGLTSTAVIFAVIATLVFAVLMIRLPYLTAAGFSPLWGAFTFPLAAYVGLMLALAGTGGTFRGIGGVSLIAATIVIPLISAKILQMWAKGVLATKTNAAVA